jgi:hypothetical protein
MTDNQALVRALDRIDERERLSPARTRAAVSDDGCWVVQFFPTTAGDARWIVWETGHALAAAIYPDKPGLTAAIVLRQWLAEHVG